MSIGRTAVGIALFAVTATVGCGAGKQIITSRNDYELYRASRVAPTVEERLGAAHRYLKRAPQGEYAEEVRAWFGPAERSYVASAHDSLPRLRAYLEALPNGPRAAEVQERVRQLEDAVRSAADRELNRDARLASLKSDLERAATQRKTFLEEVSSFIALLSHVRVWNQPVTAVDAELATRLNLADPATCQLDLCARPFTARFAIPHSAGRLVPRDASFEVEIALNNGLVTEIRIGGRELFSRIGEAQDLKPVSFADPLARAEAIGRALTLVTNAVGTAFPEATCERPAVSPVVLERACEGSRVTVTAAVDSGAADVIVFAPEAPPAPDPKAGKKGAKPAPVAPVPTTTAPKTPAPEKSAAPAAPAPAAPAPAAPTPGTPAPPGTPATPPPGSSAR
jgi:hypothetical protein